jgi:hypothetical protein
MHLLVATPYLIILLGIGIGIGPGTAGVRPAVLAWATCILGALSSLGLAVSIVA